jgi:hypothetical protein
VTRGGTKDLLVEETVSRANEHVSTPESPRRRGGVRSHRARDNVGALSSGKAGSGATGHVTAPEPSPVGRQGLEP